MGNVAPKHIVVTGAAGYLGRAIVTEALTRGHTVTAIVRSQPEPALPCTTILADLAQIDPLDLANDIDAADAVIAAAAEMTSDASRHEISTLPATENTCDLADALGAHLVHISSISVYDYEDIPKGTFVSEQSNLEILPDRRDGYAAAKIAQESIISELYPDASVLRVGALFGAGQSWNAHIGAGLGPLLIQFETKGQIPLCHIDRATHASLNAAERGLSGAVNIIDDDLPDRTRFVSAHAEGGWPKFVMPVPGKALRSLGQLARRLRLPENRLPGLLRPAVYDARLKPLGYDPALCNQALGPLPSERFERLMRDTLSHD